MELARSLKVTRGRKLRTDGTVVETNIHHPTDDALMADGVRVISRLVRRAKDLLPKSVSPSSQGRALQEPYPQRQEIGTQDSQDGASAHTGG